MFARWSLRLVGFLTLAVPLAFGQGGNGSITGTIADPSGLAVAAATVEATNSETGVLYSSVSTAAGNYTIPNLPVGTYTVTVKVPGFKTYAHPNLALAAAQVLRENATLEVGAATESVTVEAEASLLKTETADWTHNVTLEQLDDLPLLGIGTNNSGTSGYRNPYNTLLTLPGVSNYNSSGVFTMNGLGGGPGFIPSLTETMRIEGQDATSRFSGTYDYTQMAQPNADSIQEVAYQTSSYAPEFGQAGNVVINMTMKSGTNQYHGSGYDYFVNEDLNAGAPYSISGGAGSLSGGNGGKYRARNRRNDFGGTLGGPIRIPKIYNGKDKTFFFWSYEQYLETNLYAFTDTVPVPAYVGGNFGAISPYGNCSLCATYGIPTGPLGGPTYTDALGRPMYANEIYDPTTRGIAANGLGYANPFSNNVIPASQISQTALAFQKLFPAPNLPGLANNYSGSIPGGRYSAIPSLKVDEVISSKDKLSFYWSRNNTESQISSPLGNADGLPTQIGGYRGTFIPTWTTRLNYDRTLTPTMLLHLGAGYFHTSFSDRAPFLSFDPGQFGLVGFIQHRQFPSISGLCVPPPGFGAVGCGGYGGMQAVGTSGQIQAQSYEEKPSFNATATWVKGNHTFKAGAELYFEQNYTGSISGVTFMTGVGPTAQPFTPTASFSGYTQGFGYASFLLGDFSSIVQTPSEFTREGNQQWGLFLQDAWKVTRKLTLNYGLRWDYATPQHEQYGRLEQLSGTLPNANAGGFPGASIYASTCNCPFYQPAYPFAIGPRIGAAYQIDPKTVFRAGWGFMYQFIANPAGEVLGSTGSYPLAPVPNNAQFVNIATPGAIVAPTFPVTNPNVFPSAPGILGAPNNPFAGTTDPYVPDRNSNRPPRISNFSIGFQREITRNLILEASYVANRAVWLGFGPLGYLSQVSPQKYATKGLFPYPGTGPCSSGGGVCASSTYNNYADYLLLGQPISSPAVVSAMSARGVTNLAPYSGYPAFASLLSTLYPFPQFGALEPSNSPTGNSKYDSLQVKVTKRFSHGLQAGGAFTWGQGFQRPTPQDFFNAAGTGSQLQQIPLFNLTVNAVYTTPKVASLPRIANALVKDWQVGWFGRYQSGAFLAPPTSPTLNFLPSEDVRVPGQPLYTQGVNINDHSTFSPNYTQVLNPAAWAPCPVNQACAAAAPGAFGATATMYYKDFKAPRIPSENANIGRNFRFVRGDRTYNLFIRAEFVNIFNRILLPAPSTTNPVSATGQIQATIHGGAQGQLTGGFGVINAYFAPNTNNGTTVPFLQPRTGTLIARFTF